MVKFTVCIGKVLEKVELLPDPLKPDCLTMYVVTVHLIFFEEAYFCNKFCTIPGIISRR